VTVGLVAVNMNAAKRFTLERWYTPSDEPLLPGAVLAGTEPTKNGELPTAFGLKQNYPNPFNPQTTVRYDLPEDATVTLTVYNTLGQEVARLADEVQTAGYKSTVFDASSLPSGLYFYRMNATGIQTGSAYTRVMKMILVK
jgi:hypothetical protein